MLGFIRSEPGYRNTSLPQLIDIAQKDPAQTLKLGSAAKKTTVAHRPRCSFAPFPGSRIFSLCRAAVPYSGDAPTPGGADSARSSANGSSHDPILDALLYSVARFSKKLECSTAFSISSSHGSGFLS